MQRFADHVAMIVVTLWVGAMWTVGYVVAPTLFGMLSDRALAGNVAGRLFAIVGWLGIGSAAYLLALIAFREGRRRFREPLLWVTALMLLLTVVGQFGIQPLMAELKANALPADVMDTALRDRFAAWHGVSSVLYLIQSVLAIGLAIGVRRVLR
ncbi:hypothetical protein CJ010_08645 [Azoarcus sp. DD4]|uniref:DUF4149 domain-containing protein n=1 Tax=Azoarcus sp. DD4 TaxID=2027405 RepID=UPI0011277924|nr:DUF4149 domain-containing protein [Azoarcus sp. DD4]QDF96595.1 hypothetical protein CJ010_08645 [Azoarcus sp. DD4]